MPPHPASHVRQQIAQWRASGLSRAAYCREHHIVYHATRSWTKVPDTGSSPSSVSSGFIEVLRPKTEVSDPSSPSLASIALPLGAVMRVTVGTDPQWIGRVIAAVKSC